MVARVESILLAPDTAADEIIVSKRKLEELVRRAEEQKSELDRLAHPAGVAP
jgi:hypothetical protein